MGAKYRVMQVCETGEESNVHEGSEEECNDWIDDNCDQYPESSFYLERVMSPFFFCGGCRE